MFSDLAQNSNNINDDPWILAVETSGRTGSVALGRGGRLVQEMPFSAPLKHSAELFDITGLILKSHGLKAGDINQVHISYGPGSFTGIRIAVSMAKIYAFANGAKIVAINTLDVIALNAGGVISDDIRRIGVILDAKRGQFFTACYNKDSAGNIARSKDSTDKLITAAEFLAESADQSNPICLLGEGLVYYSKDFQNAGVKFFDSEYWPAKASNVLKLGWVKALRGEFADPYKLTPHYLRGPDAIPRKSAETGNYINPVNCHCGVFPPRALADKMYRLD